MAKIQDPPTSPLTKGGDACRNLAFIKYKIVIYMGIFYICAGFYQDIQDYYMKSIKVIVLLFMSVFFLHTRQSLGEPSQGRIDSIKTVANERWRPVFSQAPHLEFRPGDALEIIAFPDSGKLLNGTFFIDNEGCVDLPLIGMTKVIHRTPMEVEQYLMTMYLAFLPRMNIMVRLMYRAGLLGGFMKPGVYWVDPRGSVWDAIQQAGGTVREDGIGKVHWVHVEDGKIVTRDILPYLQSDQSLLSIGFKSGDQLTVTAMPKLGGWQLFRDNVLPVLSLTVSMLVGYAAFRAYSK